MAKTSKRALIIGGGVAGPVLAIFLQKAGIEPVIYETAANPSNEGAGLGLASNGMSVLAAAGVVEQILAASYEVDTWIFENQRGRTLATMPSSNPARHGQPAIVVTRAHLHNTLVGEAQNRGIEVHYGKRLVTVTDTPGAPVTARFEDGSTAEGDFLVGADGIRSQVRRVVMPNAPRPTYTGLMGVGGFSPWVGGGSRNAKAKHSMHFIFGANGFFGHANIIAPQGPRTMWWSTASTSLPDREEMTTVTRASMQRRMLDLHGSWAQPVPQLIETTEEFMQMAIHDVPSLPQWSVGRVALIGDAAHAVAPHSGQGASMALEDAMLMAKMLRDSGGDGVERVFAEFEQKRRPRTDRVIAAGRRQGQRKEKMPPFQYWMQQQMMRIFIPLFGIKDMKWLLNYKIDW